MTEEMLEKLGDKLMFKMKKEEYQTLKEEFDIILKQMDFIDKIKNIKEVEPMTFPFEIEREFRVDEVKENLPKKEAFQNTKEVLNDQVKVPKVVE